MKRPKWVIVVGVLGIILGITGILGAGKIIYTPNLLELTHETMIEYQDKLTQQKEYNKTESSEPSFKNMPPPTPEMFEHILTQFEFPSWFRTWSFFIGGIKALISAFYLFASISLLRVKPSSPRIFYWAAGSSIVINITYIIGTVLALAIAASGFVLGSIFGVIIHLVLLIVVVMGNKEVFQTSIPDTAGTN